MVEEITRETRKCLRWMGKKNPNILKCMEYSRSNASGKFIAVNAYIKNEGLKINNLTLHLGELENEEKLRPKLAKEIK